jgi:hypothetical protein
MNHLLIRRLTCPRLVELITTFAAGTKCNSWHMTWFARANTCSLQLSYPTASSKSHTGGALLLSLQDGADGGTHFGAHVRRRAGGTAVDASSQAHHLARRMLC